MTGPNDPEQPMPEGPDSYDFEPEGPAFDEYPDQYPPQDEYAPDQGYPFPVEGPTQPGQTPPFTPTDEHIGDNAPYEFQPPRSRFWDPTYGRPPERRRVHHPHMPNDPFKTYRQDQETEFSWGEGMYPDLILDYSGGGGLSRFPIADPDRTAQLRNLAAIRRTNVASPFAPADPYVAGNPDRFGAAPPLIRKRGRYSKPRIHKPPPPRMQREW